MHASYPRTLKRSRAQRVRRVGTMVVVGLCKAAFLLAMFEVSCQSLESRAEGAESLELELLANPVQRSGGISFSRVLVRFHSKSPTPGNARGPLSLSAHSGPQLARPAGHRLANGLLAPFRC